MDVVRSASAEPAFAYSGFGLTLLSDFLLPELAPADRSAGAGETVRFRRGSVPEAWRDPETDPFFVFDRDRDILRWNAVGAFALGGRGEIVVDPLPGVDPRLLPFPLLGPVLALYLHRQGDLVLHASAVEIDGVAVVLLGDKGAGKSTLAGALVSAGRRLLSDDLVVVAGSPGGGSRRIEAAAGQLKLYPDARAAMELRDSSVIDAELHPSVTKRQYRLGAAFRTEPAPLGVLLSIARGEGAAAIEVFDAATSLSTLLRYSYPIRFGDDGLGARGRRELFAHCADVSSRYVVGQLTVPAGLEHLGRTISTIERFVRGRNPSGAVAG